MKTILYFSALLLCGLLLACSTLSPPIPEELRIDEGVVINGIRWATRNVDVPGSFVEYPEDAGWFFTWNSRQGLPRVSPGTRWERANDPCPTGWRVPTLEEFQSLEAAGSRWGTLNGIYGRFFGTDPEWIFLPAAEQTRNSAGRVQETMSNRPSSTGSYWSGSHATFTAYRLTFRRAGVLIDNSSKGNMHSVRCVAM